MLFVNYLNITDGFILTCYLITFMRYFLRLTSAYIIVAFTIQRLILIYSPLSNKFKSKKSAWLVISGIIIISFLLNIWVPFVFRLQSNEDDKQRCVLIKSWQNEYFIITIVYTSLIMLIPILTVFICNFLIIIRIKKADLSRTELSMKKSVSRDLRTDIVPNISKLKTKNETNFQIRAYYMPYSKIINNCRNKRAENANKVTNTLVFISFSYAIFNLPYLITWFSFFYQNSFNNIDDSDRNYLFGLVQISKIFFILNYGLKFYIYCATGSIFRNQLKNSSKLK